MISLNAAQQFYDWFGVAFMRDPKQANAGENATHTKCGPGRFHRQGKAKAAK